MMARIPTAFPFLIVVFMAIPAGHGVALDELKLEGAAFLDEEACAKGLTAEGCNLSFQLTGAAAKTLYDGMADTPVKEECTGGLEKSDGKGLHCIAYEDGTAACDFGYHFGKKEFGGSSVSC
ncbi:MAG: hypothetical protein ACKVP5_24225 [Aestuariivirga sp.]